MGPEREREARGDKMFSVPDTMGTRAAAGADIMRGMLPGPGEQSYIGHIVSWPSGRERRPLRLGCMGLSLVSRAGLSSQLDRRPLAAVFVQHYVFTSMLSSHKSLRSLIMITFSVSFQPFEVLTSLPYQ